MKPLLLLFFVLTLTSAFAQKHIQPKLGFRTAKILKKNNLTFKDLNQNGKIDKYEDWRLPIGTRVKDLVSKMTIEEKVGFMLISTSRLAGDFSFQQNAPKAEITSGFNEEDLVQGMNMFSKKPLPYPMLSAAGTTKGVTKTIYDISFYVPIPPLKSWQNGRIICRHFVKIHA